MFLYLLSHQVDSEGEHSRTISLLSVAKSLDLTDDQAKKLVKTSVDMAAAMDKDVNTVFDSLLKTYQGNGAAIARLLPEVANLTKEEIKAGKAVDMVAEKFDGFGEVLASTLAGSQLQAANAFGNLQEEIGKLFSDILDIPKRLQFQKRMAEELTGFIKDVKPGLMELKNDISTIFEALQNAIKAVNWKNLAVPIGE